VAILRQPHRFQKAGDQRGAVALPVHRGGDVHRVAAVNKLVHIEIGVDPRAQRSAALEV
jgi:hypothetical protein